MKKLLMLSVLSIVAVQLNADHAERACGAVPGPTYELPGTCIEKKVVTCPSCPICPKTKCDVVQGRCQYIPAHAVQESYCEKKVCHVCHKSPCIKGCSAARHHHRDYVEEEVVVERPAHTKRVKKTSTKTMKQNGNVKKSAAKAASSVE